MKLTGGEGGSHGNRAHPHLFKLADKAIDLMKKYSSAEKLSTAK